MASHTAGCNGFWPPIITAIRKIQYELPYSVRHLRRSRVKQLGTDFDSLVLSRE